MTIYALSSGPGNHKIILSSISSKVLILFIFRSVAILGGGISLPVSVLITFAVSGPETRIIATPEIPGPDERA